jgi:hypothetical protein
MSPGSLLDMLRRRGKIRPEDLNHMQLAKPVDLKELKSLWLGALEAAESFVKNRPPEDEEGCLYYDAVSKRFVDPSQSKANVVPHFGRPGGVLPRLMD